MKRRLLATFLSLCLLVGLLPTVALATDEEPGAEPAPVCTCESLCTEGAADKTCPVCAADYTVCSYTAPAEPVEEPTEEPTVELEDAVRAREAAEAVHDEGCPLYVAPEDQSSALIVSLPDPALAAEEENSGELPVLADESLSLTGYCGADTSSPYSTTYQYSDSNGQQQEATYYSNATWKLESIGTLSVTTTNGTADETAYRLTISGTGPMGDFPGSWGQGKPWFDIIAPNLKLAPAGGSRLCIKELVIEDGITKLGAHAFEAYQNITSISMPNSVIEIGENAFNYCNGVTSITFSNNLREIGNVAFSDCDKLTSISLPDSLETIGSSAFSSCDNLSGDLSIPNNVKTIGSGAFTNDTKLNGKLTLGSSVTSIGKSAFGSCKFSGTLTIPDSVTSIGESAFNVCQFTDISLGNRLVEIGKNAFYGSGTYSGHLSIPDSVTTIGESAFSGLGFASIHLGKSVTTIGASAFINCTSVHSLDVTSVGSTVSYDTWAFTSMANPNTIYLNSDEQKNTISNYISKGRSAFAITNGGTFAAGTSFESGKLATPTKEGSIFAGWYTKDGTSGDWGDNVTNTTKGNTYYAKWIELKSDDISMEYGSSQAVPAIEGVNLSSWQSSDSSIVSIENNQLKANKVGTTTLTATASTTAGGTGTLIADVEVTPMRITYGPPDDKSDDGRPYIVYALKEDSTAPTFSELLGFYPVREGDQPGTFEPDTDEDRITLIPSMADTGDVEYCYENDASGNKLWTDTLPTHPTVDAEGNRHSIQVELKLKNPNYLFCTVGTHWEAKDTITLYVTCYEEGMNEVDLYLAGDNTPLETFDDRHEYEYTGEGIVPTERDLTSLYTKGDPITLFTAHFHAVKEGTAFSGTHLTQVENTGLTAKALKAIAPKEPGVYSFVINGYNEGNKTYCYASRRYSIVKGTPKGEPTFEKASSGVALSTVTLSGSMKNAAGAEVEGTFTWDNGDNQTVERGKSYTWTFKPGDTDHYNTVTGTAVVWPASSGGGSGSSNVNGSGDDVSISASDGSVTASQMESAVKKADEGAAITIKSTSSTTVTLPVGGMEKAADNDNDVRLDLRYGEITLSARAIAGMTDGISSNDKIKISITSQTSSKDEPISDLLDKGAAVFDVSVTVNDVEVHSFDGTLTITLTVSNLSKIIDPHILHILTSGTKEYYAPDSINGNTITVKGVRNLSTFAVIPGSEVPQNNPFVDVSTSDYYYDAVLWAVENGVTNGTSATTFSPDMAVSRAQMVTFLWRAHGSPKATGANPFTDVSTSDYYYDAVLWAVANGVTNGTSATTFSPDMAVTRAQAVTFQWRAAGSPVVSGSSFGDVATDAYYVNAVTWAVANGITNGTGGNTFSPDVVVSRAQAVTFLYRELG